MSWPMRCYFRRSSRFVRLLLRLCLACIAVLSVSFIWTSLSLAPGRWSATETVQLSISESLLHETRQQPTLQQHVAKQLESLTALQAGLKSGNDPDKSQCPNSVTAETSATLPKTEEEFVRWQKMAPNSDSVFLFSAHYDERWTPMPAVVIIGLSDEHFRSPSPKYCRLRYPDDVLKETHVATAYYRYSSETHSLRYAPVFYTCFVPDKHSVPYAVSLITDPCDTSTHNLLKVMTSSDYDSVSSSPAANFTVCVTPLNYRYDNVRQLVEMIEVNRMFGAQHFIFYNLSSGSNVSRYLDFYRNSLKTVSVVQWPIPVPVDVWPPDPKVRPEVHYFGQVAALNDCLYRCINRRSTFAVFLDLDEILVPRRRHSWSAMMEDATARWFEQHGESMFPGSYVVRNTFFRTDWTRDRTFDDKGEEYQLQLTLTTTEREEKIFEWLSRSKYIAWSKATTMVGVHSAAESVPAVDAIFVEESDALLHHYRLWEDDPRHPPRRVVDRFMHRYAHEIVKRTSAIHRMMR